MIQLSIIIISYNTKEILRNCLKSIEASKLEVNHEVIVVDNASIDGSAEMVKKEFDGAILLQNKNNNMFGKANNQAMKVSRGNFFLLLNSDTLVSKGNIEKLYDFIKKNESKIGCVGPKVFNLDGTVQCEGRPMPSIRLTLCRFFRIDAWQRKVPYLHKFLPEGFVETGKTRKVGWVPGCCMLVSRKAYAAAGGFDERFVFYGEEVEWCHRFSSFGYETWVVPSAQIVHLGKKSTNGEIIDTIEDKSEERFSYLLLKINGKMRGVIICCLLSVNEQLKIVYLVIRGKFNEARLLLKRQRKRYRTIRVLLALDK